MYDKGEIMEFELFKKKYAETMMYYQVMEHDIKYLYAYMLEGGVRENYSDIENKTLGQTINMLRDLDYSDDKPLISKGDYNFLSQICENRNHWAHKVFAEFMYIKNWESSKEYQKQCAKLEKDRDRVERAAKILEDIRVEFCAKHSR